jgi:hypothetical protein
VVWTCLTAVLYLLLTSAHPRRRDGMEIRRTSKTTTLSRPLHETSKGSPRRTKTRSSTCRPRPSVSIPFDSQMSKDEQYLDFPLQNFGKSYLSRW